MKNMCKTFGLGVLLTVTALAVGCASSSSKTETAKPVATKEPKPRKGAKVVPVAEASKVKFGEFKSVEVKPFSLAPRHANHKGNIQSAAIMDTMLQKDLKYIFSTVNVLAPGAAFSKPAERTLQIEPVIQDIRLITTGARIWVGAMAGDSKLLVQVTFRDSATGEIIANPEFAQDVNAWAGGWTVGSMDNQMRDHAVQDISRYITLNK